MNYGSTKKEAVMSSCTQRRVFYAGLALLSL